MLSREASDVIVSTHRKGKQVELVSKRRASHIFQELKCQFRRDLVVFRSMCLKQILPHLICLYNSKLKRT